MDVLDPLALFPLSDVVLLPEVSAPLYIFEPRYRQMTREALATSHQIGMVTVRPEAASGMGGDPPLFRVGCVGRIAQAQEHADGTFHILLLGEQRFRILEEHPRDGERLYRSARVELLSDPGPAGAAEERMLEALRAEILEQLERLIVALRPESTPQQLLDGFDRLEPERLVNALTQSIGFGPVERQQLLEADALLERYEIMRDLLRFRLAELGAPEPGKATLPN